MNKPDMESFFLQLRLLAGLTVAATLAATGRARKGPRAQAAAGRALAAASRELSSADLFKQKRNSQHLSSFEKRTASPQRWEFTHGFTWEGSAQVTEALHSETRAAELRSSQSGRAR